MVLFAADAWIWLEHGEDAYIPVQMIRQAGDRIIAKASTNEVTHNAAAGRTGHREMRGRQRHQL
jgi:hypothetical protein